MQKNGVKTKILQVRGGFIEVPISGEFITQLNKLSVFLMKESRKYGRLGALLGERKINYLNLMKKMTVKFDALFGEGACKKTFGEDVIPSFDAFDEFFEKFGVLYKQWYEE